VRIDLRSMHLIDFIYSNDAAEGISLVHAARAFNDLRCKFKTASAPPPRRAMIQFKIAFFPSIVSVHRESEKG